MGKLTSSDLDEVEGKLRALRIDVIDTMRARLASHSDGQARSLGSLLGAGDQAVEHMLAENEIALLGHELDALHAIMTRCAGSHSASVASARCATRRSPSSACAWRRLRQHAWHAPQPPRAERRHPSTADGLGASMFQRILLAVDGSLCMTPLVRQCLAFAASIGARVIAVHVVAPRDANAPAGPGRTGPAGDDPLAHAARILQEVTGAARPLAVPCEGRVLFGAEPWRAIVQAAIDGEADLVCMGAHGRHGAAEQVLASQAARVVEHTRIPVLLFH